MRLVARLLFPSDKAGRVYSIHEEKTAGKGTQHYTIQSKSQPGTERVRPGEQAAQKKQSTGFEGWYALLSR